MTRFNPANSVNVGSSTVRTSAPSARSTRAASSSPAATSGCAIMSRSWKWRTNPTRSPRSCPSGSSAVPTSALSLGDQGARVTVSKQEYPKYLEAVYKRESFKKPKNFIGLNKSLPPNEMEKLLLENAPVTDAELRALADQRALAVKQSLERDGKVPDSKLFLTAPKLTAEGIKDKGTPNRVDFSIRQ